MSVIETVVGSCRSQLTAAGDVIECDERGERVRVCVRRDWETIEGWAQVALGDGAPPAIGDRVVVAGEWPDELFVIGRLSRSLAGHRVCAAGGAYAESARNELGHSALRVISDRNELLFELDTVTGATRLSIPEGRLELITERGDLVLRAGGTVRVEGNAVELRARHRLVLAVVRGLSAAATWLRLSPERLEAGGERLELSARQAEMNLSDSRLVGTSLTADVERCRVRSQRWEVVAETIIERAGNMYRTVRELAQLQAARWRTYVTGLSHFRARQAYFSSEESFHVDGDKIHLG